MPTMALQLVATGAAIGAASGDTAIASPAAAWRALPDMAIGRSGFGFVHLPKLRTLLAVSGGGAEGVVLNSTSYLDMSASPLAWSDGPPLAGARDMACALLGATSVVCAGGSVGVDGKDTDLATITVLDASSGLHGAAWVVSAVALPSARSGVAAAPTLDAKGVLFVGGFCCYGTFLSETLLYDGHSIKTLAPLPFKRASLALVALPLHGVHLAFGGGALAPAYNESATYDARADRWSVGPSLVDGSGRNRMGSAVLTRRGGGAAAAVDAREPSADEWVICIGGFSFQPFFEPMASTECYSANAHAWIQRASAATPCVTTPLPAARGSPAAAAINDTCVVVAGGLPDSTSTLMLCV